MGYQMPTYSSLAQVPGTDAYHTARSYIKGQGFIHVPGQVGTYSEWMDGGVERKALFDAQMAAAHAYTYPYRIGSMGGTDHSRSYEAAVASAGTKAVAGTGSRSSGVGIAAGGTALARGGPSIGTTPGAGLIPSSLGGISGSVASAGTGVINTVTQYLPLAIKIGAALIGIKLLFWLIRGRRR